MAVKILAPPALALVLALAGAAPSLAATNPQLTVTAPRLTGYWTVTGPDLIEFKIGFPAGLRIIYSGDDTTRDICLLRRVPSGISTLCSAGMSSVSEGGIDQSQVTLRWWSGPANLIFNGTWDRNATITGGFSGGLAGMQVTGHIPATLHKLPVPPADPTSHTPLVAGVLGDLRHGALTITRYEPWAIKRVWRAEQWPEVKQPLLQLAYLGQIHVHWQKSQPDLLESVYEVRTSDASAAPHLSLCRIGIAADGRVNDFACHDDAS